MTTTQLAQKLYKEVRGTSVPLGSPLVQGFEGLPLYTFEAPYQDVVVADLDHTTVLINFVAQPFTKLGTTDYTFSMYTEDYVTVKNSYSTLTPIFSIQSQSSIPGWFYYRVNLEITSQIDDIEINCVDFINPGVYSFVISNPFLPPVIGTVAKLSGIPIIAPTEVRIDNNLTITLNLWNIPDRVLMNQNFELTEQINEDLELDFSDPNRSYNNLLIW